MAGLQRRPSASTGSGTGPRGEKGDKGDQGEPGANGLGQQGVRGPAGQNGAPGATGAPGARGLTGERGAIGPAGQRGESGAAGSNAPDTLRELSDTVLSENPRTGDVLCAHPRPDGTQKWQSLNMVKNNKILNLFIPHNLDLDSIQYSAEIITPIQNDALVDIFDIDMAAKTYQNLSISGDSDHTEFSISNKAAGANCELFIKNVHPANMLDIGSTNFKDLFEWSRDNIPTMKIPAGSTMQVHLRQPNATEVHAERV